MNHQHDHSNTPEDIRCSAVWWDDGVEHPHQPKNIETGYVLCGLRHHNCITNRHILGEIKCRNTQGFLTSKNRFVTRTEGAKIAFERGQIKEEIDILFSEDLY